MACEFIERGLTGRVVDLMSGARAVAVLGPRQAGKSTLVQMLAGGPLPAAYVTLDDQAVAAVAAEDPVSFVAGLGDRTVIDEVQRAPALLLALKVRLDRDNRRGQFLLTGSVDLRRSPVIADALPGRVDYLTLWPLTQGEIEGRPEHLLERLFSGERPRISGAPVGREPYLERVITGGFPEARVRPSHQLAGFFNGYVDSLIQRDGQSAASLRSWDASAAVLRMVAARSASLARFETVGRELGITGATVKAQVEALERLYLVRVRQAWHANLGKRQVRAPKLYVADTGLLAALVGADRNRLLTNGGLAGMMFETFVATELERQAAWTNVNHSFWHYREGEREVDVMVERPSGEVVGFEVKAAATFKPKDLSGLRHLRDQLGDRFIAGILIYTGEQTLPLGDRIFALPLNGLWA